MKKEPIYLVSDDEIYQIDALLGLLNCAIAEIIEAKRVKPSPGTSFKGSGSKLEKECQKHLTPSEISSESGEK
jgi:hypothetical protein